MQLDLYKKKSKRNNRHFIGGKTSHLLSLNDIRICVLTNHAFTERSIGNDHFVSCLHLVIEQRPKESVNG